MKQVSSILIACALCVSLLMPGSIYGEEDTGTLSPHSEGGDSSIFSSAEVANPEESGGSVVGTSSQGTVVNDHIVCLDPGHQGPDIDMSAQEPIGPGASETKAKATSGATGDFTGVPEYALNLEISLLLEDLLTERGYDVIMTRTDNETAISNKERAELATAQGAEIFVRIHANSVTDSGVSGALAMAPSASNPYVANLSEESRRLSQCILDSYCKATGLENKGVQTADNMTGINWSTVPVTILEMGFMSNENDDRKMADVEFREIMAKGIADGIDDYFGIDTTAMVSGLDSAYADDNLKGLMDQLSGMLPGDNGQWAVYVADLSTGSSASIGSQPMLAASLIKLYIMGAVYENYEGITSAYGADNVNSLLHAMITVSDNDAANTLTTYLGGGDENAGMAFVTAYCQAHGYMDSSMGRLLLHSNEFGDNYTSVRDCGVFLKSIYENASGLANDMPGAQAMYDLLKQQTRTHKIPSQLPAGVHAANKTGELDNVENDAGIIYDTAKGIDLVVCFMSQNITAPGNAQSTIGQLSRVIYDYYNG